MALISQQLPNLLGGISEQPDEFKRVNQCADSLNVYHDPVSGVSKRPGSKHITTLEAPLLGQYGAIERDEVEKYIFHMSPTGIKVWDTEGNPIDVVASGGYGYLAGADVYRYINIADTTFIVNPQVTVEMEDDLTPESTYDGMVFIRAIANNVKYTVDINGVGASPAEYTAPPTGNIFTTAAASSLATSLNAAANISASVEGPVVGYNVTGSHQLKATASLGFDYITAIPGEIENFGDLPTIGFEGTIVKVSQNPATEADDYYVRFSSTGNGLWRETVAPGIKFKLDASTMPHVLTRQADGTFTFGPFDWADRVVGDAESNPEPSFVGQKITNIYFERNRLGFLSDVSTILSESSGLNNFWRTTVSTIVDSDPIDLAVSGRQVDKLKTAIGVKDGILLFSENGQFLLNVGDADILSPETANITTVSSYQNNTRVEPTRVGDSIMFVTRRDDRAGVREYFYQSGSDFTASASITNHVPQLLPLSLKTVTGSSTENMVFFSPDEGTTLYVYQFLFSGEEKIMSAWTKWRFGGADLKFVHVFDDFLYVVLIRGDVLTLERVALTAQKQLAGLPGEICLDEYSSSKDAARAVVGPNTTFTFNRTFSEPAPVIVAASPFPELDIFEGDIVQPVSVSVGTDETTVTLPGDWTLKDFYIGTTYIFFWEMAAPFIRKQDGDVEIGGRLQVRNVRILLSDTGDCDFRVIYKDGTQTNVVGTIDEVVDWSEIADMATLATFDIGAEGGEVYPLSRLYPDADLENRFQTIDDTYVVPVMCQNTEYRLRVESDGWQAVTISKIQWEALYHKRSR